MKINRKELVEVLKAVKPVVSGIAHTDSQITPGSISNFIFTGEDVITFNGNLCIHHPFKTEFEVSVQAKEFFELISKITEDEIEIEIEEHNLKIKTKGTKACLNALLTDDFLNVALNSILDQMEDGEWKPLPENFATAMDFVYFNGSENLFSYKNSLYCYDDAQLGKYELGEEIDSFLISSSLLKEIGNYKVNEYCVSNSWIHFGNNVNGVVISTKRISGALESLEEERINSVEDKLLSQIVDGDYFDLSFISPHIDLVSILSSEFSSAKKMILFSFEKNKVVLSAQNMYGNIEKTIRIKHKLESVSFYIDPMKLSKVLQKATLLGVYERFVLLSHPGYKHIIMKIILT